MKFYSATLPASRELASRIARDHSRYWNFFGSSLALLGVIALTGGCESAPQGAVSGAGIGALSGLAIGSLSGNAGRGAGVGAVIGGVGGAAIGDQNRRRNEEVARQSPHQSQTIVVQHQPVSVAASVGPKSGYRSV
jgi:outer membrane lipoprotein SlyB